MTSVCCVCASYNRPHLLGEMVAMFLSQDYPDKELVILEDSGIFGKGEITGDGWRLISTDKRYLNIARKRNYVIKELTEAEVIVVMDDDDWYLPWHISAAVHALKCSPWAQPSQALEWIKKGEPYRCYAFGQPLFEKISKGEPLIPTDVQDYCYGGQWSYHREAFLNVKGYPEVRETGEDTRLARMLFKRYGASADTISEAYPLPSYVYSRDMSGSWHASHMGVRGLKSLAGQPRESRDKFVIEVPKGYWDLKIPDVVEPRKW